MQLSIIGAAGAVGRSLATHLLRGGVPTASDWLQLVGHGVEGTERRLLAERCDLLDAFDEAAPPIEVRRSPMRSPGMSSSWRQVLPWTSSTPVAAISLRVTCRCSRRSRQRSPAMVPAARWWSW